MDYPTSLPRPALCRRHNVIRQSGLIAGRPWRGTVGCPGGRDKAPTAERIVCRRGRSAFLPASARGRLSESQFQCGSGFRTGPRNARCLTQNELREGLCGGAEALPLALHQVPLAPQGEACHIQNSQAPGRQLVVEIPPPEPTCPGHRAHEWAGGSVQGHGGGVITVEECRRCGVRLTTDTWATDPETGEQGLRTIRYDAPESDDREESGA